MSGIAAAIGPSSAAAVDAMLDAMPERGPDGVQAWHDAPAAVGFLSFATTVDAARERQPYRHPRCGIVVALDGRLDNRDDLLPLLDVSAEEGDAAFVAAACARWGEDAPRHLLGDFAFVAWDARHRRLLAARDVMGVRPLCYARGADGALLLASEVRALLAAGVDDEINEARALEHLVDRRQHDAETLYRSVLRLPPAHMLIAQGGDVRLIRYWDFDAARTVRYRTDAEYAEHARELLMRAVRAQSRSRGRVGVLLSGGVDSSCVLALAAAQDLPCEAFTVTFASKDCDESAYARDVAAACGVPLHRARYQHGSADWYDAQAFTYRGLPDYPNGVPLDGARAAAASAGVRVLLTGVGGDEWFTGSAYRYADWLRSGRLLRAAGEWAREAAGRGVRRTVRAAVHGGWSGLPMPLRSTIKRLRGARPALPAWIGSAAAARTDLANRSTLALDPRPGESFAQADIRAVVRSGYQVHSEEMEDRAAVRAGVEQRHPFYDRRVIEFAYGLPEEQRARGARRKVVLREALRGLLPEAVRTRRDKAEFSATYADALNAFRGREVREIVRRGWVAKDMADAIVREFETWRERGDIRRWPLLDVCWMLHAMECWLTQDARARRTDHVRGSHRHAATGV